MTRYAAFVALSAFGLSACVTDGSRPAIDVLTVKEIKRDFYDYDGKVVTVRGWIGGCKALFEESLRRCGLFSSQEKARRGVIDGWALIVEGDQTTVLPKSGYGDLTGKVVVTCVRGAICLEHNGYLEPQSYKVRTR